MDIERIRAKGGKAYKRLSHALRKVGGGICANIENPASHEAIQTRFTISGWAFSNASEIDQCMVRMRPSIASDAPTHTIKLHRNKPRPDVVEVYGLDSDDTLMGFEQTIDWSEIPWESDKALLTFSFTDAVNELSVGPILVQRAAGSEGRQLTRDQYKEVWNNEASSMGSAMMAVAGYDSTEEFEGTGKISARHLTERLAIQPDDVVLEIGCGTGRIGRELAFNCKKWIGCDISGNMVEYAKEYLRETNNTEVFELDGISLAKLDDSSIDKLYCTVVFMHLEEWDRYRYIQEAFRVLKPGGKVYVDNLDVESEEGWAVFESLAAYDPSKRPPNISKTSTDQELLTYLKRAGFVDLVSHHSGQFVEAIGTKPEA